MSVSEVPFLSDSALLAQRLEAMSCCQPQSSPFNIITWPPQTAIPVITQPTITYTYVHTHTYLCTLTTTHTRRRTQTHRHTDTQTHRRCLCGSQVVTRSEPGTFTPHAGPASSRGPVPACTCWIHASGLAKAGNSSVSRSWPPPVVVPQPAALRCAVSGVQSAI